MFFRFYYNFFIKIDIDNIKYCRSGGGENRGTGENDK